MNDIRNISERIKSNINCVEYATEYGIQLHTEGNSLRSVSPFDPGRNDTCFSIRKDSPEYFKDFKVNYSGDVIDLCALLKYDGNKSSAYRELMKKTGIRGDTHTFTELETLSNDVDYWNGELLKNPDLLEYIRKRLADKPEADTTIEKLKIGYSPKQNRIVIPYMKNGRPVYFITCIHPNDRDKISNTNPKYRKASTSKYGSQPCWGLDTLNRKGPLIVAEGVFDAMAFYQEGYSVLSSMGGNFSREQKKELLRAARAANSHDEPVILIFDNDTVSPQTDGVDTNEGAGTEDAPGRKFTLDLAEFLFRHDVDFMVSTTEAFKDVNEHYQRQKEVGSIVKSATDGLEYLLKSFKDNRKGFERLMNSVHTSIETYALEKSFIFVASEGYYDPVWLQTFYKEYKKAPSEGAVVSNIKKKHELIFSEGSGFYEYDEDVWAAKTDTDIKAYIAEAYGKFKTGSKTVNTLKLLSAECNSHVEFNKKPVMAFRNGTLELDTGILRKPKIDDFVTVKADYAYNPKAECPDWIKFLREVTGEKRDKMDLLQEISGYCLFTENTLQVCAYLIGDGGNGKSVFLKTIEALFNPKSISHVEWSEFKEQFHRIHLKDSLINVTSDLDTDIRGAENILKKLTSNETIDGCLKYQNVIEFIPRAKLIVLANHFIKANEFDYALERRMLFVKFDQTFLSKGEPVGPDQHLADPKLPEKLKKELPGIFNWLYEGYKRLERNQAFTETAESESVLAEFRSETDPIHAFLDTLELSDADTLTNSEAYAKYEAWAKAEGFKKPLTATRFKKHFKKKFLERHPDWEEYRNHSGRGVRRRELAVKTGQDTTSDFSVAADELKELKELKELMWQSRITEDQLMDALTRADKTEEGMTLEDLDTQFIQQQLLDKWSEFLKFIQGSRDTCDACDTFSEKRG